MEWIEESLDVRLDGTADADSLCDAISFGLGFEAAQLTPGPAEKATPLVECCAPGVAIEDCNVRCGDGRVNGKEKCDTAIAAGEPGACPKACPAINACTPSVLMGDGCDARCLPQPITQVGAKDDCCPASANANVDPDCSITCGNGALEKGETCDPPEACPACKSEDKCLAVETTGAAATCTLACAFSPISSCVSGDGCCPRDCQTRDDQDCSSTCGNGTVDANETCDGSTACPETCDDNDPCTLDFRTGSTDHCNVRCSHIPITAPSSGDQCTRAP
jgi:hypothetical protein